MFKCYSLILCIVFITLAGCTEKKSKKENNPPLQTLLCNADSLVKTDEGELKFWSDNGLFDHGNTRSSDFAFSGTYSMKLDSSWGFSGGIELKDVKEGQYFEVSVKRKAFGLKKAFLVIGSPNALIYKNSNEVFETHKNGWETIKIKIHLPPGIEKEGSISIYCWSLEKNPVYFDDLQIKIYEKKSYPEYAESGLEIKISESEMDKLKEMRKQAFKDKVLLNKKWVKGTMVYDGENYQIKLRLKGDWIDHLMGDKWSFRIKIINEKTWKGVKEFSIQTPESRYFLEEWVYHKLCEQEDILTTRYSFVPVEINGKNLGLYAHEEHFLKQLVENKRRREGVILKMDETGLWDDMKLLKKEDGKYAMRPFYQSSVILPYKEKKTLDDNSLKSHFLNAQNLVQGYKEGLSDVNLFFDLDKLSKYYALTDFVWAKHGFKWHNQRFYYDPVISKLEVIAYDGFGGKIEKIDDNQIVFAHRKNLDYNLFEDDIPTYYPFNDQAFFNRYNFYLSKFSEDGYLEDFYALNNNEIGYLEKLIVHEFENYHYDSKRLIERRTQIKEKWFNTNYSKTLPKFHWDKKVKMKYPDSCSRWDFNEAIFLTAYQEESVIECKNYYCESLNILGIGTKNKIVEKLNFSLDPGLENGLSKQIETQNTKLNYLYYSIAGSNVIRKKAIKKWAKPMSSSIWEDLKKNKLPDNSYKISGDTIIFNGEITLKNKLYYISKGSILKIEAGSNLNFVNNAGIISESPVIFSGTPSQNINLSSDHTGRGVTVLSAESSSILKYVNVNSLNTLHYSGWNLTGALTFYESDVELYNVNFNDIKCEDGLNIIRSKFTLKNCSFSKIASDAFDADFCEGEIYGCTFEAIGNDAIDFSGSNVTGELLKMSNIGDKAISIGEHSHASFKKIQITEANIAVASKDLSEVGLNKIEISDCKYGYTIYQKKPEYGAASVIVENGTISNTPNVHFVDLNSTLELNKKIISGKTKLDLTQIFN